jgi:hypothetical protein
MDADPDVDDFQDWTTTPYYVGSSESSEDSMSIDLQTTVGADENERTTRKIR